LEKKKNIAVQQSAGGAPGSAVRKVALDLCPALSLIPARGDGRDEMRGTAGLITILAASWLGATMTDTASSAPSRHPSVGSISRQAPGLDALVAPGTRIEKLAEGFQWSEGPVWVANGRYWLFSDVPGNTIYRWSDEEGASIFLKPSGYAGTDMTIFREPGSNGLIAGPGNSILLADHGNRAIAQLDLATRQKTFLATRYEDRRFNSPNDLVRARDGTIYFTDPPYGLNGLDASPHKEQKLNGVYRLDPDGKVSLAVADLSFPNGVILSPDERRLYVAVSDPKRAVIMVYERAADGAIANGRVFADLTAQVSDDNPGLPDGMAIDASGNLFATGPGGVHVFTPEGQALGLIRTGTAIANCAFGEDGHTLFLASNHFVARLRTKSRGLGF
jgi:gluconolactonase